MQILASLALALTVPSTPHSGYHMTGRVGFEGWYHRLTLPSDKVSLGFIYSIFDPADPSTPRHGVGTQLIGPDDDYVWREGPANNFWADERSLRLGHTFTGVPFKRETPPASFKRFVDEGFQLTCVRHQGRIEHPEGGTIQWCYDVSARLGWGGGAKARQFSTAGWLAALPVFEPHYQVHPLRLDMWGRLSLSAMFRLGANGARRGERDCRVAWAHVSL